MLVYKYYIFTYIIIYYYNNYYCYISEYNSIDRDISHDIVINPRRACAQRGLQLLSRVFVCVCVCLFVVFCHHAHLDPEI